MTRRLVLSYLAVTVAVLALFEIPLAIFYQQREQDRLTVDAERDATVLATIYEDALERGFDPDPRPAQDYADDTGVRAVVVDVDGISVVDTDGNGARDFSTRPEMREALTGRRTSGTRFSDTLDTELLYVAVPVASGGVVHGALRLTLDTHEVTERVHRFWLGLVIVGVIIALAMAAVGTVIARSVTRPVRRLRSTADRFSLGDLTPSIPDERAPPELAALEDAMNQMARRLDELIDRQRSFVADASHQLRTPLTALRLRLENLQHDARGTTDPAQIDAAIGETVRLGDLVEDLLVLARTEQTRAAAPVDLTAIVRERVDTWTATADAHRVTLRLVAPAERVTGVAVPGGIEQALDNLLDNAVRAAPSDSTVTVSIVAGERAHEIVVADHGEGLGDEDKPRALARFWRGDGTGEGTGLGLAICQAIVEAGGGRMRLTDNDPTGLVVTLVVLAPGATDVDSTQAAATRR